MKEMRPIRSTVVTNTQVRAKAKMLSIIAAASLVMMAVGNHSA